MLEYLIFFFIISSFLFPLIHVINAQKIERKCPIAFYKENLIKHGFSILIPCYNEEKILATTLQGLLQIDYKNFEVIFVNDGSTDNTLQEMDRLLRLTKVADFSSTQHIPSKKINGFYRSELYPSIFLLDKENGGKADSINAAINVSNKELLITLDADSVLDAHALNIVNIEFQDTTLVAAGGTVKILQSKKNENFKISFDLPYPVQAQVLEYLWGFYIYKRSLSKLRALAIISGAFGIFRRDILLEIDGFRKTIGEDIDITIRIQKHIKKFPTLKIKHIPEALCFTECPENFGDLLKQRIRWQKSFVDSLVVHKWFFIKNLFKTPLCFFFIFDALLVGTLYAFIAFISLLVLFFVNDFQIIFIMKIFTIFYLLGGLIHLVYAFSTFRVSKKYGVNIVNRLQFTKTVIFDSFFFRFVRMLYVMVGSLLYFFDRHGWNKVERTGRVYFEDTVPRKRAAKI